MTDTVIVPRDVLERIEAHCKRLEADGSHAVIHGTPSAPTGNRYYNYDLTRDLRTLLEAAPKAEPLSDPQQLPEAPAGANEALALRVYRHLTNYADACPERRENVRQVRDEAFNALRAHPEAPKVEQEPVAGDWQSIAMWMGFAASVIKSGEPWTKQCQSEFDEALAAYGRLSSTHPAPASDELLEALEPFANGGGHRTMPGLPPDYTVADFGGGIVITVADFRRAAELYDKHKGPQS